MSIDPVSPSQFHALAKDAGNRLKSYILAYASGATGVFFLTLANTSVSYSRFEKTSLIAALLFFVLTVSACLYELHIDARRFFSVAKQLERPEHERKWDLNEKYKALRVALLYGSYLTVALGTVAAVAFLIARVSKQ
jgi:hypothetical protein